MKAWTILFVNEAAERELLSLGADLKAKFLHITEMIQEFGPHQIGLPHIRPLENKMWEIRMKGKDKIARSIYVLASQKRLVILHTFEKKTQKTPNRALETAKSRMKEIHDD